MKKMKDDKEKNEEKKRSLPLWVAGLAVGIVFLGIGAWNGQLLDMYRKAVMICLECIGIG